MQHFHFALGSSFLTMLVVAAVPTRADEGMWLFNDLPHELLKSRYDFEPSEAWAEHLRLSSVRFNSGGSASFVSSSGLVLTNHHVASDTLHKISTPEHDYMRDGFLAKSLDEEAPAPDLELNQLVSIEDVTNRVNAAVVAGMDAGEAFRARHSVMEQIEQESLSATGFRSDVITLFGGAKYHLYRYKKYTDVRVVWAPETQAAFFGGDADNFEYPRYNLDVALFRVYEDGKPAQIEHFLRYSQSGAADGEVVFVSGNPGSTERMYTVAALKFLRDHRFPRDMNILRRREILLQQYSYGGEEHARRAHDELFGYQNSRKAYHGMLRGLQNPEFLAAKIEAEEKMLERLQSDEKLKHYAKAWQTIAEVQARMVPLVDEDLGFDRRSRYYELAEVLVLMASEDAKPSEERLREYRDSARESLEQDLFSPAPIYDDLEIVKLADALATFAETRGGDDPLVVETLAGKGPRERAAELVQGSKLADVEFRRKLAAGGKAAIDASTDPMIALARTLDPEYRRIRDLEEELAELQRQAYAEITEATVAVEGTSSYPDATFTLRLAFGKVAGYVEDGRAVPPWTTLGGAFEHEASHGAKAAWVLPTRWQNAKVELDLSTPLNFVCTADIIGGNSGSPVVNRAGELVGVIFDGNIQSLTGDYQYTNQVARAVAVHSSGIREALRKIYGAESLADELGK